MKRRDFVAGVAGVAVMGALGNRAALAATPTMTTVAKIVGVPYFSLLEQGLVAAGSRFGIASNMVGPAHVDPAQQVRLVEDTIAKKVDVLGLIPLDVEVLAPVVQRARDAGIIVITQEGPKMAGRTWDVEMVDSTAFGEEMMKSLATADGREGPVYLHRRHVDDAAAQPLVRRRHRLPEEKLPEHVARHGRGSPARTRSTPPNRSSATRYRRTRTCAASSASARTAPLAPATSFASDTCRTQARCHRLRTALARRNR